MGNSKQKTKVWEVPTQEELEVSSVDALPFHGSSRSIGSHVFSQMVNKHAGLSQKISESPKPKLTHLQETLQPSGDSSTPGASSSISPRNLTNHRWMPHLPRT